MKPFILVFIATILTAGCATSTVSITQRPASLDAHTPANEKDRPGVARYLYAGLAPSVRKEQKQKTEKRMRETCGGDYLVVEEGLDLVQDNPNSNLYWYVKFTCAK